MYMRKTEEFGSYLQERAHWTQNVISQGFITGLGILEETITDMHLITTAIEFSDFVLTKKFNRREEGASSGADWLWMIGEPGSWLPLIIQAKIINPKTNNCFHLDYKNGNQRELLMKFARNHHLVPVYCIYSYIPTNIKLRERHLKIDTYNEDWACSFISPRAVRDLSNANLKNQIDILKLGIPWMDPFVTAMNGDEPFGVSVAKSLQENRDAVRKYIKSLNNLGDKEDIRAEIDSQNKEVQLESRKQYTNQKQSIRKHYNWDQLNTLHCLQSEIPLYIRKLFSNPENLQTEMPISSASIISKIPIKNIPELQK